MNRDGGISPNLHPTPPSSLPLLSCACFFFFSASCNTLFPFLYFPLVHSLISCNKFLDCLVDAPPAPPALHQAAVFQLACLAFWTCAALLHVDPLACLPPQSLIKESSAVWFPRSCSSNEVGPSTISAD